MKISRGARLVILGIVLVVIDQISKVLVKTGMDLGQQIYVIGNWFRLCFIENEGMAFGMKFGGAVGKFLLSTFRIVLCGVLCWWIAGLCRRGTPEARKGDEDKKKVPTGVLVGLTLITAGAFGNILDSLFYGLVFSESTTMTVASFGGHYAPFLFGKVVDMFYFPLWTWPSGMPLVGGNVFFAPVFNVADSCITCGMIALVLFYVKCLNAGLHWPPEEKKDASEK